MVNSLLNILLPCISVVQILLVSGIFLNREKAKSIVISLERGLLVWSLAVVLLVEGLSLVNGLSRPLVGSFWTLMFFVLSLYLIKTKTIQETVFEMKTALGIKLNILDSFVILLGLLISVMLFVISFYTPPNNADSMTYHMSRVYHWIQNGSVKNYQTNIQRQLYQPPFSEYVILNFQILSDSDVFSLPSQWIFFLFSSFLVVKITGQLGVGLKEKILAYIFGVTIPMGIMQAISAQGNYVLTFFLLSFVSEIITYLKTSNKSSLWFIGVSLGLAIFTKATGYMYALPFLAVFCLIELYKSKKHFYVNLILVATVVVAINLSLWARNMQLFNSPLGPSTEGPGAEFMNQPLGIKGLASNLIKNASLHLGTTVKVDGKLESVIKGLHKTLLGFELQNAGFTWGLFDVPDMYYRHEDISGNLLHFMVIFISAIALLKKPKDITSLIYFICVFMGAVTFSFLLRWQPWHSRLHLPLFVMMSPIVGKTLGKKYLYVVSLIVILGCIPYVFSNRLHPVVGKDSVFTKSRKAQYFADSGHLEASYKEVAEYVESNDVESVGLIWGGDDWEYPLLALLPKTTYTQHIEVSNNPSSSIPPKVIPEVILVRGVGRGREKQILYYGNKEYAKILDTTHVTLFRTK